MGGDIKIYAERKDKNGKWKALPGLSLFQDRNYFAFSFFAGVNNISKINPIMNPRGLPQDISTTANNGFKKVSSKAHTPSWLSLEELISFDYDQKVYGETDQRQGTYRDFLEEDFFNDILKMREKSVQRIVFWFHD